MAAGEFKQPEHPKLFQIMGPGLITGASDDDPSGIATYSQAGAQFGLNISWTLLLTFPLMCAIQQISAQVGRVTGRGLGGNLRAHYPKSALFGLVGLLLIANTINLGADLGAMAAALDLLLPGPRLLYVALFGVISVVLEVFVRYSRYVSVLKWLSLSLFAYVATLLAVHVPWAQVGYRLVLPHIQFSGAYLTVVVAVFGTTISPYLFFWQAGQEVEQEEEDPKSQPLMTAPDEAPFELERIRLDTWSGMAFSNLIALCIVLTTAVTLNVMGLPTFKPRPRRPKRCGRSRDILHFPYLRLASSEPACWRCRCWRGRPPMRWARRCAGRSGWRARRSRPKPFTGRLRRRPWSAVS